MAKEKTISRRRLIQLYSALLFNAHIKGFIKGDIYTGPLKNACLPGLNCYSCPGAIAACPLGALQNALASSDKKAPYFMLGIIMLIGLIFGRTVCGFLCPMGLIQELLHKIPVPKIRKSRFTRALSYLKYIILAVFAVTIPLYYAAQSIPVPGFCKYICPAGTLEGALGLLSNPVNEPKLSMLGILFTRKFVILVLIILMCLFMYRFFCRFLCPLGAIYGFFNRFSLLGVKVDADKCTSCGICTAKCEMDVKRVGDHECISCGRCINTCPTKAISWKGGKIFLKENEVPEKKHSKRVKLDIACAVIAALLLAFVLWFTNSESAASYTPSAPAYTVDDSIPAGSEVGMRCPSFTAPMYNGGGEFDLTSCLGYPTVINFWATWCGPCCKELPYFQQLADAYPDIKMVAVHSDLITDDVQAYLDKQPYTIPFALDETGSVIASLGGSMMLPQTVVLDRNGIIVYNAVGSVTYEKLEDLILPLLENAN